MYELRLIIIDLLANHFIGNSNLVSVAQLLDAARKHHGFIGTSEQLKLAIDEIIGLELVKHRDPVSGRVNEFVVDQWKHSGNIDGESSHEERLTHASNNSNHSADKREHPTTDGMIFKLPTQSVRVDSPKKGLPRH